jgi:4,5-dihydroxyphthalate decarboxylase
VTEIGLHPFMLAYANDDFRAYSLLPVFPLRLFRHKSVFIRTDRGIDGPEDLKGKVIATPGYASTSLTWIRGIFEHEYGISPMDVEWVIASKDSDARSGKTSKQEQILPQGVPIRQGPATLPSQRPSGRATRSSAGSSRTTVGSSEPISQRPGYSPSCTRLRCATI